MKFKRCEGFSKVKGLMFAKKLKNDKCLVLVNASDIHMWFVFQSIDVVWLNKNRKVIDKRENVKPFTFARPKKKAYYVLEMPLGKAKLFKLGKRINLR